MEESNFQGADPGDVHVHAACVACGADYLLTTNERDFRLGQEVADSLPYEILSPDEFFTTIAHTNREATEDRIDRQIKYRTARRGEAQLPEALAKADSPQSASSSSTICGSAP